MQDMTKMLIFGGGVGLLAGIWGYVKSVLTQISGFFIIQLKVNGKANEGIQALIWSEFSSSYSSFYSYSGKNLFSQKDKKVVPVAYEYLDEKYRLFFDGWKPIIVRQFFGGTSSIFFFRWSFRADDLLRRAFKKINDISTLNNGDRFSIKLCQGKVKSIDDSLLQAMMSKDKKSDDTSFSWNNISSSLECHAYRMLDYKTGDIGEAREGSKALERIVLDEQSQSAVDEAHRWAKSASWFEERHIPWRRGYLFYGEPGTGKSSLVAGIGKSLGVPIFRFDISTMTNQEFSTFWTAAASSTPAIVLIEDIDNVFHGRSRVGSECADQLNFDHLLNTISGIENSNGILLIITTNNLEHIDPALGIPVASNSTMSTRPGRIDRVLHLKNPDAKGREIIARRILKENTRDDIIKELVDAGKDDTGAQFQERCSMMALKLYWKKDD
jgi:SpoVK/Ycf46/Vps4 family AAA+-type ATPase